MPEILSRQFDFSAFNFKLYQHDCVAGMNAQLQPQSIDTVVTSPPYNIGIKYSDYDDTISREHYLKWLDEWAVAVKRVLKDDGSFFLNIGGKPSDPWGPFDALQIMRAHFALQNTLHWIKSIYIENSSYGNTTALSVGHYKPINSARYVNDCHEFIFHFTKTGAVPLDRLAIGVPYKDKTNVARWAGAKSDRRCRGNTWFIPYATIQERAKDRPHPASFPPRLVEMCAKLHGVKPGMTVLDPFLGIGSAAVACHTLGVNFVGFEMDPEYFQIAVRQIESYTSGLFKF